MLDKLNLNKIDKNKIKDFFIKIKNQYDRDAVIYTIVLLGVLGYGGYKFILPAISELPNNFQELSEKNKATKALEVQLALSKKPKQVAEEVKIPIKIYESPYKDAELESAATNLVNQIISIIKSSGDNTVENFQFVKKELTDKSGLKSDQYFVLSLQIQMKTNYESLQNILNEIFLMEYLVKIQNISLGTTMESDFSSVTAFVVLDIYIKTS